MKHLYVAASLIEAAGLGVAGTDLFVGTMPHDVMEGIMLKDPLYGAEVDDGMRGVYTHWFQLIVRSADPLEGYERARAAAKAIYTKRKAIDGLYIVSMAASALPVTYPKGDADATETSVRISLTYGELDA
jgi:hypothetical protein